MTYRYLSFIIPGPPDPVEVLGNEGVPEPDVMFPVGFKTRK